MPLSLFLQSWEMFPVAQTQFKNWVKNELWNCVLRYWPGFLAGNMAFALFAYRLLWHLQSFGDQDRVVEVCLFTQIVTGHYWDTGTDSSRRCDSIRTDQHHPEAADCEQSWWTLVPEWSGWRNSPPPTAGHAPLPWRKRVRQSWPTGIVGCGTAQGRGVHLWLRSLERHAPHAGTVGRHWHPGLVNDFRPLLSACSHLRTCSSDAVDFRGTSVVRWPWLQCEYTGHHIPPCCWHNKAPYDTTGYNVCDNATCAWKLTKNCQFNQAHGAGLISVNMRN